MTNKKILFWLLAAFMIIITLKSASAQINLSSNMVHYYTFDTANSSAGGGNPTMKDWFNTANVTSSVNTPTWNLTGQDLESWDYEYSNTEYSLIKTDTSFITEINTMCAWVKLDNGCPDGIRCGVWEGDDNRTHWHLGLDPNEKLRIDYDSLGAPGNLIGNTALSSGDWHHICFVIDTLDINKELKVYINGSLDKEGADSGAMDRKRNANRIGASRIATTMFDGLLDEIMMYSDAKNATFIQKLYNETVAGNYTWIKGGGAVDTINLSSPYPLTNTQFNTNPVNFWVLANASQNWTCRLYINGTLNQTSSQVNGTNVNCSFQVNMSVGKWYYWIRGNTSLNDENTSNNTFYFDNVNPVITVINWTNSTLRYNTNITGQFNITDNFYLHRLTTWVNGVLFQNITDINSTQYIYNLSYDVTNLTPGIHTLTLQVADGHTAQSINTYDWTNGLFNDYLKYSWDENYIRIDSIDGSILDSFSTTKLKDRYSFSYEPWDNTKKEYNFLITSSQKISIAKRPKYQTWLISGEHWLDFVGIDNRIITITPLNNYSVNVNIKNLNNTNQIIFNSIGDLNVITQNFTFATTNMTTTYSAVVNELEIQTSTLTIYKNAAIINTSAGFTWNGTVYNISADKSNASYDYYNITFLTPAISASALNTQIVWFYNVTGTVNNLTGNITLNQTVIQIGIDNCSVYTVRAINISLLDESNDSLVTGYINGYFEVWVTAINQYRAFNLTWAGNSTYGLCINNASATYFTNGQLEYGAPSYAEKNYFLNNITLNNVTDILNLYLTKNTTLVILTVTDQNGDPVQDVYIHIQTYDLGTDSFKTTEIVKTDFQGRAFAQMILNTQWYQFMLVYDNVVRLQTDATRQTSATRNFQINLGQNIMAEYDIVQQAVCDITFNNATNRFRLNFLFPSSNTLTATLSVYNQSIYSKTLINSSSLTASSGTIFINIGTPNNITYLAQGYITIDGEQYSCGILSRTFGHAKDVWGLDGLFMAVLLIIFVIMATIWAPSIAVLATLIVVIMSTVLGIFYLSWPYLITLIIIGGIAIYRLAKNR